MFLDNGENKFYLSKIAINHVKTRWLTQMQPQKYFYACFVAHGTRTAFLFAETYIFAV
jgi:hypothetical protein